MTNTRLALLIALALIPALPGLALADEASIFSASDTLGERRHSIVSWCEDAGVWSDDLCTIEDRGEPVGVTFAFEGGLAVEHSLRKESVLFGLNTVKKLRRRRSENNNGSHKGCEMWAWRNVNTRSIEVVVCYKKGFSVVTTRQLK
jgi:hypothetical protein